MRRSVACHCSEGRGDRAGAYIIDAILAHRYLWKRNLSFCGVVGGRAAYDKELALLGLPPRRAWRWGCTMLPASKYRAHLHTSWQEHLDDSDDEWPLDFLEQLRARLRANCSASTDGGHRVVVHLRRGDVTPNGTHRARYTSNSAMLLALQRLQAQWPPRLDVLIHSQNESAEPFDAFRQRGYRVALDAPITTAWRDMACAHALLMARSSFSYVPALFNRNRVFYQPLARHLPLPGWELIEPNSSTTELHAMRAKYRPTLPPTPTNVTRTLGRWADLAPNPPQWHALDVALVAISLLAFLPYAGIVAVRGCARAVPTSR